MSNTAFSVSGTVSSGGGSGTVTQVNTGTGLTGGPITTTGTIGLGTELSGLNGLSTTGLVARTGSGTYSTRTVTGTASRISVTNGNGISGDPTLDLIVTAVTPGSYTSADITVDAYGRLTAASNGVGTGAIVKESVTLSSANLYAGGTFSITSTPSAGQVYVPVNFLFEVLPATPYIGGIAFSLGYGSVVISYGYTTSNSSSLFSLQSGSYNIAMINGFNTNNAWNPNPIGTPGSIAAKPLVISMSPAGLSDGTGSLRVTAFYTITTTS